VLTISHELRTPLAIVKASLDALHLNWEATTEERRRNYVNVGRQGANRLKRLLENLLFVSRIETRAFSPRLDAVDLTALTTESAAGVQAGHPDRTVELALQPDLPFVLADRSALGEVITHLLENAFKYSPEGSSVVIGGAASADGESVDFWVTDHGIGIAPEDMGRLFQRFERIDPTVRSNLGTGLGLYISRELIKSMGGRITAHSEIGLGTTFTVSLPAARAPREANALRPDAATS
jgi:signal transduction histidine kinase